MALACPLCKEALFDPTQLKQTLSTAQGYALSIGLLLAVPCGLVAGLILLILRAQTRARRGTASPRARHRGTGLVDDLAR